ncbi:heterokaryon incompatibility protein-domain-containing protein [Paraphoma chrysanthemicola]|uniref:Heterokaryon incompatibility protein-domain-containing protein n=1 Tax=Paraphoma chrysanthemicola TaxID=798071 RepID=A0A8K0R6N8_9PLEO|nr:heterokaryon incompatibility protein-domain-containing protein [Paraphoma chrysanthemicola]
MLCNVCRNRTGNSWNGSYALTFKHHNTIETLKESEVIGCIICKALANELKKLTEQRGLDFAAGNEDVGIQAGLSRLEDRDNLALRMDSTNLAEIPYMYRLDFELQKTQTLLRTFALKPTSDTSTYRTPTSKSTGSDEVLELSRTWIQNCTCADKWKRPHQQWYPKRLLDLTALRNAKGVTETVGVAILSQNNDLYGEKIKLIETATSFPGLKSKHHPRYVTLSHCWGAPKEGGPPTKAVVKLTTHNEEILKSDGVELRELPKTFQEAILFACRLDKVGYMWIDSLCIKQKSSSPGIGVQILDNDWLEQSRIMDKVYEQSYLNISATASQNSDEGLFRSRDPNTLWEEEVNLNWTGRTEDRSQLDKRFGHLTRCTIIDVSFWEDLVEHAPVNQRGWVLQERVMCPRVLHFCKNQIAWECREFQRAEGYPDDLPTWTRKLSDIVDEGLFKRLRREDGERLRQIRLQGLADPDRNLLDLHVFELWKRIVEVYSRTKLTVSTDKLIALSGIAKRFSEMFSSYPSCKYIAGMWLRPKLLESQLLWQVEDVKDGVLKNHSRRDSERAPSFSWASLDTPHGIIYGETTDYGKERSDQLFFEVVDHEIVLADKDNVFGMLESGQGRLWVQARYLRKIDIRTGKSTSDNPFGHTWHLSTDSEEPRKLNNPLDVPIVNFDAPEQDIDIGNEGELYCMPAAFGERTANPNQRALFCLLLKLQKEQHKGCRSFKRFGMTKLFDFQHSGTLKAVREEGTKERICLC